MKRLGLENAGYPGRLDIWFCPLGVRADEFGIEDRADAQRALGLPTPGEVTLLCLGRMSPADKYDLLAALGLSQNAESTDSGSVDTGRRGMAGIRAALTDPSP